MRIKLETPSSVKPFQCDLKKVLPLTALALATLADQVKAESSSVKNEEYLAGGLFGSIILVSGVVVVGGISALAFCMWKGKNNGQSVGESV